MNDSQIYFPTIDAAVVEGGGGDNSCVLRLRLREGVNREVRRVCEHFGWRLLSLSRSSYGPWTLADLPEGQVEEVPQQQLQQQLREMRVQAAGRGVT